MGAKVCTASMNTAPKLLVSLQLMSFPNVTGRRSLARGRQGRCWFLVAAISHQLPVCAKRSAAQASKHADSRRAPYATSAQTKTAPTTRACRQNATCVTHRDSSRSRMVKTKLWSRKGRKMCNAAAATCGISIKRADRQAVADVGARLLPQLGGPTTTQHGGIQDTTLSVEWK